MHELGRARASLAMAFFCLSASGCRKRVSAVDCDQLIDRYATLVATERDRDASAAAIAAQQAVVRDEAKGDENFQSCATKITVDEYQCAMAAKTTDVFEKCLD